MCEEVKLGEIIKKYSSKFPGVKIEIVSQGEIKELKKRIYRDKKKEQLKFKLG